MLRRSGGNRQITQWGGRRHLTLGKKNSEPQQIFWDGATHRTMTKPLPQRWHKLTRPWNLALAFALALATCSPAAGELLGNMDMQLGGVCVFPDARVTAGNIEVPTVAPTAREMNEWIDKMCCGNPALHAPGGAQVVWSGYHCKCMCRAMKVRFIDANAGGTACTMRLPSPMWLAHKAAPSHHPAHVAQALMMWTLAAERHKILFGGQLLATASFLFHDTTHPLSGALNTALLDITQRLAPLPPRVEWAPKPSEVGGAVCANYMMYNPQTESYASVPVLARWRQEALAYLSLPSLPDGTRNRVIYLRRIEGVALRTAVNLDKAVALFATRGVRLEPLSISSKQTPREQVQLVRSARLIISPHGSHLNQLMFAEPGVRLIEVGVIVWSLVFQHLVQRSVNGTAAVSSGHRPVKRSLLLAARKRCVSFNRTSINAPAVKEPRSGTQCPAYQLVNADFILNIERLWDAFVFVD